MTKAPAIGIDLGTTFSCVCVVKDGEPQVVSNDHGHRITPSLIGFDEKTCYVGNDVDDNDLAPANIISDSKRLMGRMYDNKHVQEMKKKWLFEIVAGPKNEAKIKVKSSDGDIELIAEEVGSKILAKMKKIAEEYLQMEVTEAVITVPAYFDNLQRQATIVAGQIAGLKVLKIISEPTAAAIAFGQREAANNKTILVFDLGGGTFDVSIMSIKDGVFTVLATSGDSQLGGQDFTQRLVENFAGLFQRLHDIDLTTNKLAMKKLTKACENAKRALSNTDLAPVKVLKIMDNIDLESEISREKFEIICGDLFKKTTTILSDAISEAKLDRSQIDDIVLVGGSTRIPAVQKLLAEYFDGKKLNKSIHPDEAVAIGAAIQAAKLSNEADVEGTKPESSKYLQLVDVIPLSLGVSESELGNMAAIIERNTAIPCSNTRQFTTHHDNQTEVLIKIYQGERKFVEDNVYLGEFELGNLPPKPVGEVVIDITLNVDVNGVLHVTASRHGKDGQGSKSISITKKSQHLSQDEVKRLISEAEESRVKDEEKHQLAITREKLECLIYTIQKGDPSSDQKKTLEETLKWLPTSNDVDEIEKRLQELKLHNAKK